MRKSIKGESQNSKKRLFLKENKLLNFKVKGRDWVPKLMIWIERWWIWNDRNPCWNRGLQRLNQDMKIMSGKILTLKHQSICIEMLRGRDEIKRPV